MTLPALKYPTLKRRCTALTDAYRVAATKLAAPGESSPPPPIDASWVLSKRRCTRVTSRHGHQPTRSDGVVQIDTPVTSAARLTNSGKHPVDADLQVSVS